MVPSHEGLAVLTSVGSGGLVVLSLFPGLCQTGPVSGDRWKFVGDGGGVGISPLIDVLLINFTYCILCICLISCLLI